MGVFVRMVDYVDDKNLYGYSLFGSALALLFLGLFLLLMKEWSIHGPTNLPIIGIESPGYFARIKARRKFVFQGFRMVGDAYYKYYGKSFVVTTNSYYKVILTPDQVKELANASEDTVSISHASAETMMAEYTGIGAFIGTGYIREVTKVDLTRNLGHLTEGLVDEARFALDTEIPGCTTDEWKSVDAFTVVVRTVARMSGRSFIGLPLCRNEDWLTLSIDFTGDVFRAAGKLSGIPRLIRPFYAYIWNLSEIVNSQKRKAQSILASHIEKRLEEKRLAENNGPPRRNHNDLIHWFSDRVKPHHRTVDVLSQMQLMIGLAAIHTTASAFVSVILDLAELQEYIQPIREEMEAAISENGGVVDREVLRKMRKADSFFKESMRTKTSLFSFSRMAMKNFTFSDGTYVPKGTLLGAPSAIFSTDPNLVENPETFDGFRWYKKSLEAEESKANLNNCTATTPVSLSFGHGKHACPGRYFAVEEMKIMLIFILLQYDFKYPEGQSRPPNIQLGEFSFPNRAQKLLFKKRPGPKKFSFLQ